MSFSQPRHEFLNFIRGKESFTSLERNQKKLHSSNEESNGNLSGTQARSFYESVIASNSTSTSKSLESCQESAIASTSERSTLQSIAKTRKRQSWEKEAKSTKKKSRIPDDRIKNRFLQFAQEGNLIELRNLLKTGSVDINTTDQFQWTALMCAAHRGQGKVVRYLLKKGALWENVVNSQGKTAKDLAHLSGHSNIVGLFKAERTRTIDSKYNDKEPTKDSAVEFWCSVCQEGYTDSEKNHTSSTVHQFNCQHKPPGAYYCITDNNPGYKLMVKSGWDEETGLGPEGLGRKYPIKTVLKRDRLGLGNIKASKEARVTHFRANDETAVKRKDRKSVEKVKKVSKKLTKKDKRNKESKEKMWEQNMRIYMSTD